LKGIDRLKSYIVKVANIGMIRIKVL